MPGPLQLSATVQVVQTNLVLLGAQVSALQQAAPAQHSSSAASAGAADASSAAAGGIARDGLGWPLGGMKASATVFHDMSGVGGQTSGGLFGGGGGTGPAGQTGGGAP